MQLHQPIVFPDVEAVLISYLGALVSVPVVQQVSNPRPSSFVLIRRTGGPRTALTTDQAQVTIECWAGTSVAASNLASVVRAHLGAAPNRAPGVRKYTEFSGPAFLPDQHSQQSRYTWTAAVSLRGSALTS